MAQSRMENSVFLLNLCTRDVVIEAPIGNMSNPPIIRAANHGKIDLVQTLLGEGADVNAANEDGNTALMMAASSGHIDVARALIDAGANLDAVNSLGDTALHLTVHSDIVQALVDAGANFNIFNKYKKTALGTTVTSKSLDAMMVLIEAHGDVNVACSRVGCTALMLATCSSDDSEHSQKIVQALLDEGADVNAVNEIGDSVLSNAVRFANRSIVQMLLNAGADPSSFFADIFCNEAQKIVNEVKNEVKRREALVNTTEVLRKEPSSYFFKTPGDVIEYLIKPMVYHLSK